MLYSQKGDRCRFLSSVCITEGSVDYGGLDFPKLCFDTQGKRSTVSWTTRPEEELQDDQWTATLLWPKHRKQNVTEMTFVLRVLCVGVEHTAHVCALRAGANSDRHKLYYTRSSPTGPTSLAYVPEQRAGTV